jgi:hypothetical protein
MKNVGDKFVFEGFSGDIYGFEGILVGNRLLLILIMIGVIVSFWILGIKMILGQGLYILCLVFLLMEMG